MTTPAEKYGLEKPECGILEHAGYPFHIIGRVISALMDAGYPKEALKEYIADAEVGDYGTVIQVTMEWVEVV